MSVRLTTGLISITLLSTIGVRGAGGAADEFPYLVKRINPTGLMAVDTEPTVPPRVYGQRLHDRSEDCAQAKVDMWFTGGGVRYVIFAPGQMPRHVEQQQSSRAAQIRLGRGSCRINVSVAAQ